MNLRIGSLCSGYRGLDMAVERVFGGTTAWVSDIDPGACKILAHHWPTVPNLGDLTTARWEDVEPVDIVCGGYPCQPFSSAGRRRGTEDERHIWPYIAHALGVLRPRYAVFENVAGHVRLGFDAVLADLARLGFDAEWCLVRASEVGAPHQRQRLFLLATAADADGTGLEGRGVQRAVAQRSRAAEDADGATRGERGIAAPGQAEGRRARSDARGRGGASVAHAERHGLQGQRGHADQGAEREAAAPVGRELARSGAAAADAAGIRHGDAGPARVGRVPAAPVASGAAALPDTGHGREPERAWSPGREEGERPPVGSVTRCGGGEPAWGRFGPAVARWEAVTGRRAPWATDDRRRLSPAFVEWMMGLPAGHVTGVPDLTRTEQLKALGNGVVPQQATAALQLLLDRAAAAA